jgi:hypothetical protein
LTQLLAPQRLLTQSARKTKILLDLNRAICYLWTREMEAKCRFRMTIEKTKSVDIWQDPRLAFFYAPVEPRISRWTRITQRVARVRRKTGKGAKGERMKRMRFPLFPLSPLPAVTPGDFVGRSHPFVLTRMAFARTSFAKIRVCSRFLDCVDCVVLCAVKDNECLRNESCARTN